MSAMKTLRDGLHNIFKKRMSELSEFEESKYYEKSAAFRQTHGATHKNQMNVRKFLRDK